MPDKTRPTRGTIRGMKSYEVIIDGDRVAWVGERPPDACAVRGTFRVADPVRLTDGADLVRVIDEIRADGGVTCFGEALAWQRRERAGRPSPGREP